MEPTDNHFTRCKIALKESKLFGNLGGTAINEVLGMMSREYWPIGTFKNSDDFNHINFYFILSGRVKMYYINPVTGRYYTIEILDSGDCFDVLGMLNVQGHHVYFETLDEVEVLCASIPTFRNWMSKYLSFTTNLLTLVAERNALMEDAAKEMCLGNTLSRLAGLLVRNTNSESKKLEHIGNLPNEEIASLLGTTRAVVNRNIQELKDCGAIAVSRKHIEILDSSTLLSVASSSHIFN